MLYRLTRVSHPILVTLVHTYRLSINDFFTELNFEDCLEEASIEEIENKFGTSTTMHEGDVFFEPEEQEVRYSGESLLGESQRSAEEPRKRVVRFFDEQESSDHSIEMGGLLPGGMAGNHTFGDGSDASLGTLDMFDDEGLPSRTIDAGSSDSNIAAGMAGKNAVGEGSSLSLQILDIFHDKRSSPRNIDAGSSHSKITSIKEGSDDESDDESVDSDAEKEKELRKSIMYAVFGMGAMGLAAFGFKRIMSMMNRDRDHDAGGAVDMVRNASDPTAHLSDVSSMGTTNVPIPPPSSEAIAQASMNTSAQQASSTFVASTPGNYSAAMTGAQ
jgi:hypothetical protein